MKIFNVEDGKKKVYVQMNDITMLSQAVDSVPASILGKIYSGSIVVCDSNRMNFIEFSSPEEIRFFENQDWIVDYKKLRNLSEKELIAMWQSILDEIYALGTNYVSMSEEERVEAENRFSLLYYKSEYISEIIFLKRGMTQMPFPVVPDSDGFTFVGDSGETYTIKSSLDPNKFLLFRSDGKSISDYEEIPQGFLKSGVAIALVDKRHEDNFYGDYEMSYSMSDDRRYLIIGFKVKSYTSDTPTERKSFGSGIKKLVNRFLGRSN